MKANEIKFIEFDFTFSKQSKIRHFYESNHIKFRMQFNKYNFICRSKVKSAIDL